MSDYFVHFYGEFEYLGVLHPEHSTLKVTEDEVFLWIERAHVHKIQICVYKGHMVLDLS